MASGTLTPRLDMKTPGSGLCAWRGPGMFSVMSAYQKKSCSSSGTLRMTSTYIEVRRATSQFLDSRPMPISVPRMVASTMPMTATRSVFSRPTRMARP